MRPNLGTARLDESLDQPVVIGMGMRDDDALQVLEAKPEPSQSARQRFNSVGRMRPGVDKRQRVAFEQIGMYRAHWKRGWQGNAMDSTQDGRIKGVDGNGAHRLVFFALDQDGPCAALDDFVFLIADLDFQSHISTAQPRHWLQL